MIIIPLLVQNHWHSNTEQRNKYLVFKTKTSFVCQRSHNSVIVCACVCVCKRQRDLVYLLRWYSMPCRASMSLLSFFLCLVSRLSATRWRSGTLLLRGIKHCIFRLWLTDLLYGLHNHLFLRMMRLCGEWCHAASPALVRCSQTRSQPKVDRKFFFILFFYSALMQCGQYFEFLLTLSSLTIFVIRFYFMFKRF